MAEGPMIAPIFKTAVWGLSDDIFNWINWSFFYSKNLNTRSGAREISLNKRLSKNTATVITEKINAIIKTSTNKMLAFWENWGIYWKDTTTRAKISSNTPATKIYSAIEYNEYVYWTTSTQLHRIKVSDLSGDIKSKEAKDWHTLENSDYYPMLVSMWDLYIWHAGMIGRIDPSNVFEDTITMDSTGMIKIINDLWGSIRVITIPSVGNSKIYLWDWITKAPDQTIPLKWYDIRQSEIYNGYNYLITNKGIGVLDGYKIYPLKNTDVFNDNIGSITIHNEKLCIWGKGGIYTYGAENKNYPESLVFDYQTSMAWDNDEIGAIFSDWVDLYVSRENTTDWNTTYGIDLLSSVYYSEWELITRGYFANDLNQVKEWIRLILGYKELVGSEEIVISYAVDWWAWEEIAEFDKDTVLRNKFTEEIVFSSWDFQYIQFKIKLKWDSTTTPKFYSMDLIFNNINR